MGTLSAAPLNPFPTVKYSTNKSTPHQPFPPNKKKTILPKKRKKWPRPIIWSIIEKEWRGRCISSFVFYAFLSRCSYFFVENRRCLDGGIAGVLCCGTCAGLDSVIPRVDLLYRSSKCPSKSGSSNVTHNCVLYVARKLGGTSIFLVL